MKGLALSAHHHANNLENKLDCSCNCTFPSSPGEITQSEEAVSPVPSCCRQMS